MTFREKIGKIYSGVAYHRESYHSQGGKPVGFQPLKLISEKTQKLMLMIYEPIEKLSLPVVSLSIRKRMVC